jgi:hypothetical protein
MTDEDWEFNRIEMEARVRMMAVRYAMERAKMKAGARQMAARYGMEWAREPSPIPLITDEEWEELNKEDDAIPPQSNT